MKRNLMWFAAGAIGLAVAVGLAGLIFLKTGAEGFSARSQPSFLETFAAGEARSLAIPAAAKQQSNPVVKTPAVLEEAMAHWADHCAVCHGNDGSGEVEMGRQMYPHAPDMRNDGTQKLTDGELFYIIENGIRLSGMPGWGGAEAHAHSEDSWKLVHFIRHLPDLTAPEIAKMEKLNPKGPGDKEEERREEDFLNNRDTTK
ncbi:MAG: c-type cytochrome [Acidobacteriota bacterium]|nr:c-type cytochrome [Acidobacteriota bacterium]